MGLKDVIGQAEFFKERALHDETKAELRAARKVIRDQQNAIARLAEVANIREGVAEPNPDWLSPRYEGAAHGNKAVVCAMLSDLHLDEVVRPEEMHFKNAYNREIAEYRLERFFTGVELVAKNYVAGVEYDGLVLPLGGDLVSGGIHEELRETNEAPTLATVRHYFPKIADGISYLADVFGHVHVPCVPGNHGRMTAKPRYKLSALDNADWLMCSLIAERLAGDDRITFDVPESLDTQFTVYDTTFHLYHGQTGGGAGIGGIWPPIMRLRAKKAQNFTFDWFCIGHWHQYVHGQGLTINGSLKGYDEFALGHSFAAERPQQAFWVVTPENGVTFAAPIFCGGEPEKEGWAQ